MSQKIGSMYYEIGANTTSLKTGLKDSKSGLLGLAKGFLPAIGGAALLTAGATALAKGLKFSIDAAAEAQKVDARLEAVLKSTGYAAGMTKKELDGLANSLSNMSGIDDELIKQNEALLLTFTRVGSEVFPEAMEAAMNMSVALGSDLQGSIIMVGKAMNVAAGDTSGASTALSAMRRVGVAFTSDQIEMAKQAIATGDTLEYQRIILEELGTEFGGQAKAVGDTYTGAVNKLKTAVGNLGETIGEELLPPLTIAVEKLAGLADNLSKTKDVNEVYSQMMRDAGYATDDFVQGVKGWTTSTWEQQDAIKAQARAFVDAGGDIDSYNRFMLANSYTIDEWKVAAEKGFSLVEGYKLSEDGLTIVIDENTVALNENKIAAGLLNEVLGGSDMAWGYAESAADDYNGKLEDQIKLQEELALASGKVTQEQLDNSHAQEQLVFMANQYGVAVEDLSYMMQGLAISGGGVNDVLAMIVGNLMGIPQETRAKILIEQFGYKTGSWVAGVSDEFGQLIDQGSSGGGGGGGAPAGWTYAGAATTPGKTGWYVNDTTGAYQEFAKGGRFRANQDMMVGEEGIEMVKFDRPGVVVPSNQLGGRDSGGDERLLAALSRIPTARDIALAVRDAMLMAGGR